MIQQRLTEKPKVKYNWRKDLTKPISWLIILYVSGVVLSILLENWAIINSLLLFIIALHLTKNEINWRRMFYNVLPKRTKGGE